MNKKEAEILLDDSRKKIDDIDDQIIDLIDERTSLAFQIATAKKVLNKEIKDTEREEFIQEKIKKLAKDKNINEISLKQIIDILTDLSIQEQERILRR
ncbi:MAG: chorismate mutase [Methanobacterium sp.]|nr:chorismate mutase [Methanobacterium sp.]